MKTVFKLTLAFFGALVIYLLVFQGIFSARFRKDEPLSNLIALGISILVIVVLWKKIGQLASSFPGYVFGSGLLLGIICFCAGFFGPLVFTQSSNQGPLLGIFLTGPMGFFLGLAFGVWLWNRQKLSQS